MKENTQLEEKSRGINGFTILYYVGLLLVAERFIHFAKWTINLIVDWKVPEEPFFSKISLTQLDSELSVSTYLGFAIAYMVFYCFIFVGLIRLNKVIELMSEKKIFFPEVSSNFKKAGNAFMIFVVGTFAVDFILLMVAWTSVPAKDLFATETIVFVILSYLLYFLADILKEGISLKEENDLTI